MIDIKTKFAEMNSVQICEFFLFLTLERRRVIIVNVGFFRREGGVFMRYIMSFVVAIVARLVGDCVSKWFDGHNKAD